MTTTRWAQHLGVDRRTVRRYVTALQQLGIPVVGERGVSGGCRLRPGYRLPPLMLTQDEAVAITIGTLSAQRIGIGDPAGVEAAIAKIRRVLPETLRRRVEALEATLAFTAQPIVGATPATDTTLALAEATRRHRRVRLTYRSYAGEQTERELSPYGLVVHAGRWYLWPRTTTHAPRCAHSATPPPPGFDALAHVTRSLAQVPWPWEIDVLLHLSIDEARQRIPSTLAELAPEGRHTRLRMRVSSLDWAASLLASLDCELRIQTPEDLRTSIHQLATRLLKA